MISHLFRIIMIPLRSGNGVPFHSKRERVTVEVTLHKYFFVQRLRERSMTTRPEEAFNLSPLYCIYTIKYIFSLLRLAVKTDRVLKPIKKAAVSLLEGARHVRTLGFRNSMTAYDITRMGQRSFESSCQVS